MSISAGVAKTTHNTGKALKRLGHMRRPVDKTFKVKEETPRMNIERAEFIDKLSEKLRLEEELLEECIRGSESRGKPGWASQFVDTQQKWVIELRERLARLEEQNRSPSEERS